MKKKELIRSVQEHFEDYFHHQPKHIFLSPGRINIIGEHVDYNDGFVLPAAVNKYICFAVSPAKDKECTLVAIDLNDQYKFNLDDKIQPVEKTWVNYILGVLFQLKKKKLPLKGFQIAFGSNLPKGAGLSSSAALECGFGFALNTMFGLGVEHKEITLIGQKAEHTFVGVNCGIMDQFASVYGKKDHVIKLDCNSLDYEYHKAPLEEYSLLLLDSKVKHAHLSSGYNDRRREVEDGLKILKKKYKKIKTFRDVTVEQVEACKELLGDVGYKRCLFVVKEINRVLQAVEALEQSDFQRLGNLLYEGHEGLSKGYEISCPESDFLVATAKREKGILGARQMGGGFGGCTINLVKKSEEKEIIKRIRDKYRDAFDIKLKAYKVKIADGTREYKTKKVTFSL